MGEKQKVKELIQNIFDHKLYSAERGLQLLTGYGGIVCLINHLNTCQRLGLTSNDCLERSSREKIYGCNKEPKGENLLRKYISQQRDFIVNLLLYLLTLQMAIKLVLIRQQYQHQLQISYYPISFLEELIPMILLCVMIFLKARVNIEYFNINKDQRKYRNQQFYVKRDGEILSIEEERLLVGDILLVRAGQMVRVDGIILTCHNLIVSQAQTILRRDSIVKHRVWEQTTGTDPFLLSGSVIITGSAEVLICTVGQECSFRRQIDNPIGHTHWLSPILNKMKKLMLGVEIASKVIVIVVATVLSFIYLEQKIEDSKHLTWEDFLYVLEIYTSMIGMMCFIQRLKIIRSLHFFLETNTSGNFFRVRNKTALEKLSTLDILFIESCTLDIRKNIVRDHVFYQNDHIEQLSELNSSIEVKIIYPESNAAISPIFGSDIQSRAYLVEDSCSHREKLASLIEATFISNTTIQRFIEEVLPLYRALNYTVGFLSNASNEENRNFPKDLLLISFSMLELEDQVKTKVVLSNEISQEGWIKIHNKLCMEDVLLDLSYRSYIYAHLFNTYVSLFFNNLLVLSMFCWFSISQQIVTLSWSLAIIIVHRYMFFTVYRRLALCARTLQRVKIRPAEFLKLNIYLLPLFCFVTSTESSLVDFFIFFFINSLFRVEILLLKINLKRSFKRIFAYIMIFVVANALNYVFWQENDDPISSLRNSSGLMAILLAYGMFLE